MKYYADYIRDYNETKIEEDVVENTYGKILRTFFMNKHERDDPYAKEIEMVSRKKIQKFKF